VTWQLDGAHALVTGAGSGIGRAVALALSDKGARILATDVIEESAMATAEDIAKRGGNAAGRKLDVLSASDIEAARRETSDDPVSVIVNCAGFEKAARFTESDPADWQAILDGNLLSVARVTHAFIPGMIASGQGGRIVSISSDAGRVGSPDETLYSAAKAGVVGFSKALAREMIKHAITVNCVSPGPVDTPFFHALPERTRTRLIKAIPARRLARPSEVAAAVAYFAGGEAGYVTGQVLSVSGGLTMVG